jgi:hypothetical protein
VYRVLVGSRTDYTGQKNLTFFVPRGKISNPDSTFNAEFKHLSSFSPSPTVFFVTAKLTLWRRATHIWAVPLS